MQVAIEEATQEGMDALETKGRVGLHRWPRESCCTWGDSRFASSRQLVCDKSKDGNPMTLILIPFLNQPPAARFFCCASRPGGNEGRRKGRSDTVSPDLISLLR